MKTVFLAMALLAAVAAQAQFKPRASLDYFPDGYDIKVVQPIEFNNMWSETSIEVRYGKYRARIGAEYDFGTFSAYFDQSVFMDRSHKLSFRPTQAEWRVGIKVPVSKTVFMKYEHFCAHPISSDDTHRSATRAYGYYNMISISYGY